MDLLDDDPFANLSACTVDRPRPVVVSPSRPRSSGHGQARPAYTKPAFPSRPSLPSLHTLAQLNVSIPGRKIRKGTPGARLPHEPWDLDLSTESNLLARISPSTQKPPDDPHLHESTSISLQPGTREFAANSLVDETSCSRSLFSDDADIDSLPSLSYTSSVHSSSTLSRSSSSASPHPCPDVNSPMDSHNDPSPSHDITEEDDPLSYHSDFDYYTQSFSDPSDSDSDRDIDTTDTGHRSPPLDVGITPYCSLYDPALVFESGSSPDTMRKVSVHPHHPQTDPLPIASPILVSRQDGDQWRGPPPVPETHHGREDDGRTRDDGARNPGRPRRQSNDPARGNGNSRGAPRQGKPPSSVSSTSDSSTSSSDDDADGVTVYYSFDGMSNGPPSRPHSRTRSRHSKAGGGSDDDVPLAQRVPTALSAQKSIRKQLHDERQQRRLERARSSRKAAEPPLPCPSTEHLSASVASARFRKRSVSAAPAPTSGPRAPPTEPFPVEDLTRKLMNLQASSRIPPVMAHDSSAPTNINNTSPRGYGYAGGVSRSSSRGRYTDHATHMQQKNPRVPEMPSQDRPLRSARSFHRSDGRHSETQRRPIDQASAPRLARSATAASSRNARAGRDAAPVGYEQHTKSGRVSEEGRRPSASVPRSSIDRENDATQRAVQRPPVPPLPISDSTPPQLMSRGPVVQQRIFIGDMQRFNMVEITPTTNAGDVLDTVARQGMLDKSGSWMVFEMAQDYGMERPIRDYELLADVSASWNKDKLLNAFVIKQTPLAQLLGRSALPSSSPTYRGWVEWESKRGKWSKRWMELREHGLWLSKRDTGKDEVFLCSLSNFDAYFVTRRHKSPKAFVFAIKSTDHLSMFENVADYLHVFSCNPMDGEKWMQAILVARSYVLYQERNVLFAKTGESLSQAKPLARSRTRKQSISSRPAQPLVNVPPPFSQAQTANVAFEPGSLLAKRKEVAQL